MDLIKQQSSPLSSKYICSLTAADRAHINSQYILVTSTQEIQIFNHQFAKVEQIILNQTAQHFSVFGTVIFITYTNGVLERRMIEDWTSRPPATTLAPIRDKVIKIKAVSAEKLSILCEDKLCVYQVVKREQKEILEQVAYIKVDATEIADFCFELVNIKKLVTVGFVLKKNNTIVKYSLNNLGSIPVSSIVSSSKIVSIAIVKAQANSSNIFAPVSYVPRTLLAVTNTASLYFYNLFSNTSSSSTSEVCNYGEFEGTNNKQLRTAIVESHDIQQNGLIYDPAKSSIQILLQTQNKLFDVRLTESLTVNNNQTKASDSYISSNKVQQIVGSVAKGTYYVFIEKAPGEGSELRAFPAQPAKKVKLIWKAFTPLQTMINPVQQTSPKPLFASLQPIPLKQDEEINKVKSLFSPAQSSLFSPPQGSLFSPPQTGLFGPAQSDQAIKQKLQSDKQAIINDVKSYSLLKNNSTNLKTTAQTQTNNLNCDLEDLLELRSQEIQCQETAAQTEQIQFAEFAVQTQTVVQKQAVINVTPDELSQLVHRRMQVLQNSLVDQLKKQYAAVHEEMNAIKSQLQTNMLKTLQSVILKEMTIHLTQNVLPKMEYCFNSTFSKLNEVYQAGLKTYNQLIFKETLKNNQINREVIEKNKVLIERMMGVVKNSVSSLNAKKEELLQFANAKGRVVQDLKTMVEGLVEKVSLKLSEEQITDVKVDEATARLTEQVKKNEKLKQSIAEERKKQKQSKSSSMAGFSRDAHPKQQQQHVSQMPPPSIHTPHPYAHQYYSPPPMMYPMSPMGPMNSMSPMSAHYSPYGGGYWQPPAPQIYNPSIPTKPHLQYPQMHQPPPVDHNGYAQEYTLNLPPGAQFFQMKAKESSRKNRKQVVEKDESDEQSNEFD